MKAAIWRGGSQITIDDVPDPSVGSDQVLVRVHTAGVCATEVHMTQGLVPGNPPSMLGHEFSGEVVEVGDGVDPSLVGARVACEQTSSCGKCVLCLDRRVRECAEYYRGYGFAELALLPSECVHPLPADLDLEEAAMVEPAACALAGLEMFEMPDDAVVVVIGGGVLGLFTLAFARMKGARITILTELLADRRSKAHQLGADHVIDPKVDDLKALVDDLTDGRGAHVVAEAVGKPELVDQAYQLLRPRGNLQLVGVNPKGSTLPTDLFDFHFREIIIRGAYGYGGSGTFQRALNAFPSLNLNGFITTRYPIDQIEEAFAATARSEGVKTAVAPNSQ